MKKNNCEQFTRDLESLKSERARLELVLRDLRGRFGQKTVTEARDLMLLKNKFLNDLELLRERYGLVIVEETSEGRRIKLDLKQERQKAVDFYLSNGLESFAKALPRRIILTLSSQEKLREVMRDGWDRVMLFPDISVQESVLFQAMKKKMADTELPGLKDEQQYRESLAISLSASGFVTKNSAVALRGNAYFACYSTEPLEQEFFDMKYEQLKKVLSENGWDALTVVEYYIMQRQRCAESGNHDFDRGSPTKEDSQQTWLLGSGNHVGQVPYAGWWPEEQQIVVNAVFSNNSVENVGLRPIRVVPVGK